jgi:hypothetical protein
MACSICSRPGLRLSVDAELMRGQSERAVAAQFGAHPSSVHRHKLRCLGRALSLARNDREQAHADVLAADLEALAREAARLKAAAEASGDLRTALQGLRELTRLLALRAALAGRLRTAGTTTNVVNVGVQLDPETATKLAKTYLERHKTLDVEPPHGD